MGIARKKADERGRHRAGSVSDGFSCYPSLTLPARKMMWASLSVAYASGSSAEGITMAPLAFFITFTTYGTWLHGRAPGSVDRQHNIPDTPFLPPDREREREMRSEEHTSELQSLTNLVCRLLLEKKKK